MPRKARYTVTVRINGKKKYFYGKTKSEAVYKRDAYTAAINDFPLIDEKITLAEWVDAWLESMRNSITPNTYRSYRSVLSRNLFKSPCGNILLSELKPTHFRIYQQKMIDKGLSPRTINYFHTVISASLKQAVYDGVIPSNPLLAVRRVKQHRQEAKALTEDQIKAFFEHVTSPVMERIFSFALQTGMRRSEILGLRWADIDFQKKTASVNQTVLAINGKSAEISETTKTKSSRRTISLSDSLVDLLKKQRVYFLELQMSLGITNKCDLVFPSRILTPLAPDNVSREAKKVFRAAGLPEFTFHSFRHTHATYLIEQGINFKIVQYRLGHSNYSTTMDIYSHVTPGMDYDAAVIAAKMMK